MIAATVEETFQLLDSQRTGKGQQEIEEGDRDPDFKGEIGGGHEFHALKGEFLDGYHGNDGGIFDGRNELTG